MNLRPQRRLKIGVLFSLDSLYNSTRGYQKCFAVVVYLTALGLTINIEGCTSTLIFIVDLFCLPLWPADSLNKFLAYLSVSLSVSFSLAKIVHFFTFLYLLYRGGNPIYRQEAQKTLKRCRINVLGTSRRSTDVKTLCFRWVQICVANKRALKPYEYIEISIQSAHFSKLVKSL